MYFECYSLHPIEGLTFQALRQVVYFCKECLDLPHDVKKFDLFILRCVKFYF